MKLFYSLITLGVGLQVSAYLFWIFNVCPFVTYPLGNVSELSTIFSITPFDLMFTGIGLAVIGLAGLLLRQGTYAIYAMILWVIGTLLGVIRTFFLAIPNTIGGILNLVTSSYAEAESYVVALTFVFSLIFLYAFFWFMLNVVAQRDVA
jgi:hypothetical protein